MIFELTKWPQETVVVYGNLLWPGWEEGEKSTGQTDGEHIIPAIIVIKLN